MFEWAEYFKFAARLTESSDPSEAELRSAISRAYYAAFHITRDYLIHVRRIPALPQQHVHAAVWRAFRDNHGLKENATTEIGFRLLSFRRRSDYESSYPALVNEAGRAIRETEILISTIARLSRDHQSSEQSAR